jgi:chromosome partitioning protein
MKVISILSQKGGATKTSLAIHLAVAAIQDGKEAMIIDLDPQASATRWKDLRSEDTPVVVSAQASRLAQNLDVARSAGADLIIIDTAPHSDSIAATAARSADLILIPTRCSIFDIQTVPSTVDIAKFAGKPTAIVLTAIPHRGMSAEQAKEALEPLGIEICPYTTGDRAAYKNAPTSGLVAAEYEPKGKAAEEIQVLYNWVCNKVIL